ncbi:MAG: hypothetical protein ACRCVT_01670 [Leadbetterella sp.]
MKPIFICIILILGKSVYCQDYNTSIKRIDNDFTTYFDKESPKEINPKEVSERFKSIVKNSTSIDERKIFFSFKINVNTKIDIYALNVKTRSQNYCYLIAYDKSTKNVSFDTIRINMKWASNSESGFKDKLLKFPLLEIYQENGKYMLTIRERVHNGNTYNALIKKIFSLKVDLSFDLKLCFEEKSITFDGQVINRVIKNNAIFIYKDDVNSMCELLGKIEVDIENKKIVKKECNNSEYCEILYTCSGEDDELFLKYGYKSLY